MGVVPIRVVAFHDEYPDIRRRQLNEICRQAHQEIGEYWSEELLPEHFLPSARHIFGYAPRRTQKRKERLAKVGKVKDGGLVDLVHSGLLRDSLTKRKQLVTAQPSRTIVWLIGPSYFGIRYKAGRPNLAREVSAMSDRHERLVTDRAERAFNQKLRELRATRIHKT